MRIRYWSSDLCSSDLRVLKHDLHPGAESFASPLRHVGDTLPAEADLATIAVEQTGAEPRQGGLAAARFADQPDDLAARHRQRHAVHRRHDATAQPVAMTPGDEQSGRATGGERE